MRTYIYICIIHRCLHRYIHACYIDIHMRTYIYAYIDTRTYIYAYIDTNHTSPPPSAGKVKTPQKHLKAP